jgi:hypothetical protein
MTFEEAMKLKALTESAVDTASKKLRAYPRQANGLVPRAVRDTDEYQEDKYSYDTSFAKLRAFNEWFTEAFASEYREYRQAKRACK